MFQLTADMRENIYFPGVGSIIIMVTKDATPWGLLVAFTDVVGIWTNVCFRVKLQLWFHVIVVFYSEYPFYIYPFWSKGQSVAVIVWSSDIRFPMESVRLPPIEVIYDQVPREWRIEVCHRLFQPIKLILVGFVLLDLNLLSPPVFSGFRVARSFVFCIMFCRSLFVLLSFFAICPSVYGFWLPLLIS